MYTKPAAARARLCAGAITVISTVFAGSVTAGDNSVTVAIPVDARGLDLNQPADARTFYTRLQNAAWVACTRGNRADLVPVDHVPGCIEKALADAVRASNQPLVTQIYLASHTMQEALARGVALPAQVAAK